MYNLLIVDDERVVVDGLAKNIDWEGLNIDKVFKAYNGKEAIEIINKRRLDIVIADIKMPEMTGLELAKQIREKWPLVKVIILSGYEESEIIK